MPCSKFLARTGVYKNENVKLSFRKSYIKSERGVIPCKIYFANTRKNFKIKRGFKNFFSNSNSKEVKAKMQNEQQNNNPNNNGAGTPDIIWALVALAIVLKILV